MNILKVNNKKEETFLRKKLPHFDIAKENKKELKALVKTMREVMHKANGVGLSANQIGVPKRMFVAEVFDETNKKKFYAILNPEITKTSKEKIEEEEGCLSVPLKYGPTARHEKVTLEGYTLEGKKVKIKAWGLLAKVFQHEVDHLNGKLFIDIARELHSVEK